MLKWSEGRRTYHLPELVRSWKLNTCALHDERLFSNRPMLELVLDVCQPWLRAAGVTLYVLFVRKVFLGLWRISPSRLWGSIQRAKTYHQGQIWLATRALRKAGRHREWRGRREPGNEREALFRGGRIGRGREKEVSNSALPRHHCWARESDCSRDGETAACSEVRFVIRFSSTSNRTPGWIWALTIIGPAVQAHGPIGRVRIFSGSRAASWQP
jgi:hypothetical protein